MQLLIVSFELFDRAFKNVNLFRAYEIIIFVWHLDPKIKFKQEHYHAFLNL